MAAPSAAAFSRSSANGSPATAAARARPSYAYARSKPPNLSRSQISNDLRAWYAAGSARPRTA